MRVTYTEMVFEFRIRSHHWSHHRKVFTLFQCLMIFFMEMALLLHWYCTHLSLCIYAILISISFSWYCTHLLNYFKLNRKTTKSKSSSWNRSKKKNTSKRIAKGSINTISLFSAINTSKRIEKIHRWRIFIESTTFFAATIIGWLIESLFAFWTYTHTPSMTIWTNIKYS